jgi:hypothetical protein
MYVNSLNLKSLQTFLLCSIYFFLDLAPEHFQRLRDKLFGVFGSFAFFLDTLFLIPKLLAQ